MISSVYTLQYGVTEFSSLMLPISLLMFLLSFEDPPAFLGLWSTPPFLSYRVTRAG